MRVPAAGRFAGVAVATVVSLVFAASATAAGAPDPGGNEEAIVPVPPPDGQAFGFNDHSMLIDEATVPAATVAQITKAAGANIQRITVNWQEVEPERNVISEPAWDRYEAVAEAFKAQGQRLLVDPLPGAGLGP